MSFRAERRRAPVEACPARVQTHRSRPRGHGGRKPGPLFCSGSGARPHRQNVDDALKTIAAQANAALPEKQHIHLSAHLLRHTFLRKIARKHGVEYAKELAGHTSERYIWRYVQPSDNEKEAALEDLF